MKDFKNFKSNKTNEEKKQGSDKDAEQIFKQYSGKSKSELFNELAKQVEKAKKEGTFSKSQLMAFYEKVSPMLSAEEREKLLQIINQL